MKNTLRLLRKGIFIISILSLATFGAFAGGNGGTGNGDENKDFLIIVKP